ncbi:hypothetical protein Moror_357 [Moniliophthora roreri MCA 2997]|uniref:DUF6699 domain-containing protein n=2 Tax=Moniliophthora roreri TaxID=221103 RepID=V2XG80_MONRO|nr:hypothetical protein Moror_357 [Moniliophthora roreri MCA 2997]
MPGLNKHVHWATPSPPSTVSSLPSSPGPLTPPQHTSGPYTYQPLPAVPTQINPVIGYNPQPYLRWDMTLVPDGSSLAKHTPGLLEQSATQPALPFITIIIPELFNSTVQIKATTAPYVTVGDVLHGIYRTLRQNITQAEYNSFNSQQRPLIDASYKRRYTRFTHPAGYKLEKDKGAKRVDLLLGRTLFMGLTCTGNGPDVWQLHCA